MTRQILIERLERLYNRMSPGIEYMDRDNVIFTKTDIRNIIYSIKNQERSLLSISDSKLIMTVANDIWRQVR